MRSIIGEEINRIRQFGEAYKGPRVFIDRDQEALDYEQRADQHREDLSVYGLYRRVHQENQGCLKLGDDDIWLITCKVPNQGKHRGRAADLLGVRQDGSVVVFECKVGKMRSDTPLLALLESLDYLGHLMIDKNFDRLRQGFLCWKEKQLAVHGLSKTPPGFECVDLNPNGFHSAIVLAPKEYYAALQRDSQNVEQDWEFLSDRYWPNGTCTVRIDFAITDYTPSPCTFLPLTYSTS
jgi:hypothetical protein